VQAADAGDAVRAACSLLEDPERRKRMGEAGIRLCEAHRGATRRHLALCEELLRAREPG